MIDVFAEVGGRVCVDGGGGDMGWMTHTLELR